MAAYDFDGERKDVLRSIVVRAQSQGYLIRSETIAMLPVELFTRESQESVLDAVSDMGIPIVDTAPTAAELVAMQTARVSGSPEVLVSPPLSHPIGAPIVVLHVGAEGGEIRLIAQELTTAWRYRCTMLDQTDLWLEKGASEIRRQSTWVYEWNDALAALDKYPWAELHPLAVNPQFADRVLAAARTRLAKATSSLRVGSRLAEWSALCHG